MRKRLMKHWTIGVMALAAGAVLPAADPPASCVMLSGPWLPENPHQLDFQALNARSYSL